ncbi:unnamed protein product, partial [Leptidea sinapis]
MNGDITEIPDQPQTFWNRLGCDRIVRFCKRRKVAPDSNNGNSWGIRTVINLQTAGEHASCGPPLTNSGFTYDPVIFMANDS